jgi:hypothetical protein
VILLDLDRILQRGELRSLDEFELPLYRRHRES